jgi:2-hydroxy-3-oxopropionate reductase
MIAYAGGSSCLRRCVVKGWVGFIGLGIMGTPMARNLCKAGVELAVYDLDPERAEALAADGAVVASSVVEVARRCATVITMLPDGPDVEQVVLGEGGLLAGMTSDGTILDTSSISPVVARRLGAACAQNNVAYIDAPVSGGEQAAIDAKLAIMVGGRTDAVERVRPLLDLLAARVTLVGEVGAGSVAKLANQIIVASNIAALGEALVLAGKAGVDPERVVEAVRAGLAGSAVLEAKAPCMLERRFSPGFRIRLHRKDLRNAMQTAESIGASLPLAALLQQMLIALSETGRAELDHSALVLLAEEASGIQLGARDASE